MKNVVIRVKVENAIGEAVKEQFGAMTREGVSAAHSCTDAFPCSHDVRLEISCLRT